MDKIVIHKPMEKVQRKDSVILWASKDISDELNAISERTGLAKQVISDFLLRKALEQVVVVEGEL